MKSIAHIWCILSLVVFVSGCDKYREDKDAAKVEKTPEVSIDGMKGLKLDVLINNFGLPQDIRTSDDFGAKFAEMDAATVVLTYHKLKRHVYLTKDCVVLLVLEYD